MNSKHAWRLWRSILPVAGAATVSFGVARAIATPASPPAQPAASAVVTPKTDRPPAAGALSEAFAGTARASRASVVRIDVEMSGRLHAMAPGAEPQPDDQDALPPGTGSGVVVDASGDIVTNSHVVDHASVTMDGGEQIPASVIGRDPQTDLATV